MLFVTRTLYIAENGERHPVEVRIFSPEPSDRSWMCHYEIDWPGQPRISAGYGFDGMQAFVLTMQKIAVELYASSYHHAGTLELDRPGAGYGFPMTKNSRDLLIGDDARFDGN